MTCETAHNRPTKLTSNSSQPPRPQTDRNRNQESRGHQELDQNQELDQKPKLKNPWNLDFTSIPDREWCSHGRCRRHVSRTGGRQPPRRRDTETAAAAAAPRPLGRSTHPCRSWFLGLGESEKDEEGIGVEVKKRRRQLNWKDAG